MNSKDFLKTDSLIVIQNPEDGFRDGVWKVLKISDDATPKLLLESAHRANQAFLNTEFDAKIMRPFDEKNDLVYKDAFLPIGSTIETTTGYGVEEWKVDAILSGDNLDNARLRLKKELAPDFNVKAHYMTTKFKPEEMKIKKLDTPKLSRFKPK